MAIVLPTVVDDGADLTLLTMHLKASTLSDKKNRMKAIILPRLGLKPLNEIGVLEKDQLAASIKEKGLSASSINNTLGALGSVLRYAEDVKVINAAPPSRFVKVPESDFDFLDFDEYNRLMTAAKTTSWFAAVLVGGDAGLRLGEIRALKWDNLDLVAKQLSVKEAFWKDVLDTPKGGKSRKVPMTSRLTEALREVRHLRGPFVFCKEDGAHYSAEALQSHMRRICKRAGLRDIGWHGLRHTFCSHLAMKGATGKAVQELAGHRSLMTTQRYMHLAPSHLREAISLLEGKAPASASREGEA